MTGLTKAARQAILDDYLARHNGRFDAGEFLTEVRAGGEDHPAFGWFTWDDDRAAHEHRLWQARTFARDLRVTFNVETLERGAVRIRTVEAPRLVSPLEGRQKGGGYVTVDPESPEAMRALCAEAAASLQSWLRRYGGALAWAGGSTDSLDEAVKVLAPAEQPAA